MTREEALNELNYLKEYYNDKDIDVHLGFDDEDNEAIDLAIKALKQEPKIGHWIYTLEDWNKWECSECGFTKRTDVHISIVRNVGQRW